MKKSNEETVNFLNEKEVRTLYYLIMKDYGGAKKVLDKAKLASSIAEPKTTYGYTKGIYQTAAAYGYFFCKNHIFMDGNKRIAYTTMRTFLLNNGYDIIAKKEEKVKIMLQIAENKIDKKGLAIWLKEHTTVL